MSQNLQELRISLCQTGAASQGARDFVLSTYQELKRANPKLPILIRECAGVKPRMTARYDFGKEESISLEGLDKSAVSQQLEKLVSLGDSMPRSTESEGKL